MTKRAGAPRRHHTAVFWLAALGILVAAACASEEGRGGSGGSGGDAGEGDAGEGSPGGTAVGGSPAGGFSFGGSPGGRTSVGGMPSGGLGGGGAGGAVCEEDVFHSDILGTSVASDFKSICPPPGCPENMAEAANLLLQHCPTSRLDEYDSVTLDIGCGKRTIHQHFFNVEGYVFDDAGTLIGAYDHVDAAEPPCEITAQIAGVGPEPCPDQVSCSLCDPRVVISEAGGPGLVDCPPAGGAGGAGP